jgi:hypothetical protein
MKANQSISDDLLALEEALKAKFHPIEPDQHFVGNLRARLEDSPIYQQQRRAAYIFITTAGGLLLGLIIFLIGKGLLQESKGT